MSDLTRELFKSRMAGTMPSFEMEEDNEEEELLDDVPTELPTVNFKAGARRHRGSEVDYTPVSSAECFEQAYEVSVTRENSDLYRPKAAVVTSLSATAEGGDPNTSALSDSTGALSDCTGSTDIHFRVYYNPCTKPFVFVGVHGAGSGALTFSLLARHIRNLAPEAGFLAYDSRGHGKTTLGPRKASAGSQLDYSLDRQAEDLLDLLRNVFPEGNVKVILVGHSMGGAVCVRAAHLWKSRAPANIGLTGICVLDVVEGTAVAALPSMAGIIASYPPGFESIERAISWHIESGLVNSVESARMSVPSLVVKGEAGSRFNYVWRADLQSTEPYWRDWFTDLSSSFLTAPAAKMLVLAGVESIDETLLIGQMQGKFQHVLVRNSGHYIQEDAPVELAKTLVNLYKRNDITDILANVKKVGQV